MLKYEYKLRTTSNDEEIELNDFYISSDLSYISGTTSISHSLSLNDKLWITSSYFPTRQLGRMVSLDIVKRNGYITYPLTLEINTTQYIDVENNIYKNIKYVQYNGNTYYQDTSNSLSVKFNIDGEVYQPGNDDTELEIADKAYIENNKVLINGIEYSVVINKNVDYTVILDSVGKKVEVPDNWNLSNISLYTTEVQKIVIGNRDKQFINCKNITYFGYQPYVAYNGDRYNFDVYIDQETEEQYLAIYINGTEYRMDNSIVDDEEEFQTILENYGQFELYNHIAEDVIPQIEINGENYTIQFEMAQPSCSDSLCVELSDESVPILVNDIININADYDAGMLPVRTDNNGVDYVYCNCRRHNVIKGLCDTVIINNIEYEIDYPFYNGEYYKGMVCHVTVDDGSIMYFAVSSTIGGYVNQLTRIKKDSDDNWIQSFTMTNSVGKKVVYETGTTYTVNNYDGVYINGIKCKLEQFNGSDGYYYVDAETKANFQLEVQMSLGSNKLICHLFTNTSQLSTDDYIELTRNAYEAITSSVCTLTKIQNCFGRYEIIPENWVNQAYESLSATSIYELTDFKNDITIHKSSNYFNLPLTLSSKVNNDFLKEDLIIGSYYDEKADEAINKIVDMDKDMYIPIFKNEGQTASFLEKIRFNLHFRTRDMSNWSIIEDEGYYISGQTFDEDGNETNPGVKVPLGINHDYCNWFITDYYPYNQVSVSGSSTYKHQTYLNLNMKRRSDLLGLLYFTTDDVKNKRNKLSKSFLRLTYYDSTDPDKQNMLGTSTLFFDCDRYFDVLNDNSHSYIYSDVIMTRQGKRINNDTIEEFNVDSGLTATVTRDVYTKTSGKTLSACSLYDNNDDDFLPLLDSRIVVSDRNNTTTSSEGFYAYILKSFSSKVKSQTIYMKMEFFHAGIGIKIPMVFPTETNDGKVEAISSWTYDKLEKFKEGYDLNKVHKQLYIPITIEYNKQLKNFAYYISGESGFSDAILDSTNHIWNINLFELKTKAQ